MNRLIGKDHANWKGGRHVDCMGYVRILRKDHPLSDNRGYIREHRFIAAEEWGIEAIMGMDVHHINGDTADNRIENLEILSKGVHTSLHSRGENSKSRIVGEPNPIINCKCGCDAEFNKYDKWGRPRMYKQGHRAQA